MKNITRVLTFIFIGLSAFFFVNYSNALDVPTAPTSNNTPNDVPDAPNPPQNDNQVPTVPPAPTLFPGCETCEPSPTSVQPTPTKPSENGRGGNGNGGNGNGDGANGNGNGDGNGDGGQGGAQVVGLAPTSGEYNQAIGLIMFGSLMLLVAAKGYQEK